MTSTGLCSVRVTIRSGLDILQSGGADSFGPWLTIAGFVASPLYNGGNTTTFKMSKGQTVANLGKLIVGLGVVLIVLGLFLWLAADKLSWLGSLPGDIKIERPGFRFYAPITTMLILSVALSILFWVFGKFFR